MLVSTFRIEDDRTPYVFSICVLDAAATNHSANPIPAGRSGVADLPLLVVTPANGEEFREKSTPRGGFLTCGRHGWQRRCHDGGLRNATSRPRPAYRLIEVSSACRDSALLDPLPGACPPVARLGLGRGLGAHLFDEHPHIGGQLFDLLLQRLQ